MRHLRTVRLLLKLVTVFAILGCVELVCARSTPAQDINVIFPESVLNRYALTVGSVSGSGNYESSITLPVLRITPRSPREAEKKTRTLCAPLADTLWSWNVSGPRFQVKNDGVRFFAFLTARMGASSYQRPIEIAVTTRFNSDASTLELSLTDTSFPVFLSAAGETTQVGSVNLSSSFSTILSVPTSFSFSGRTVALKNVNIHFLDGSIEVTGDLEVR